ncbi:hypothetical protein M422DRAFT_242832 [Sphaerobolus stellatus SS14]|nr:hypothetical protein M422DRAFT_242832 [Sphaerobolus stellatus SS14]
MDPRRPMHREPSPTHASFPDGTASTSSMRNIDSDCIPVTHCSMNPRTPPYILLSFDVCAAQTALSAADDSSKGRVNASTVLVYNFIFATYAPALYTDAAFSQTAPSLDPTTMHCVHLIFILAITDII